MTTAATGDTVRIHYSGRLTDGTQFDSSEGRAPLEFTLGQGQVIKGLEQQLQVLLFERRTREIALTEVGAALFAQVEPILTELDKVTARFLQRNGQRRVLRITLLPYLPLGTADFTAATTSPTTSAGAASSQAQGQVTTTTR